VRELKARGYKEIVLTGIHIGSYGFDLRPKSSLLEIVDKITSEHPDIRIRLTSIEPQEFKGEFLSLIKKGGVCPHLHIPLQSGSDRILRAMNRGYSTSFYKALINDIYSEYPDISIGTDIIAGFPGETEEDFEHTVEFIENLPLSYIHVFSYSPRPGTKASEMDAQIDSAEKKRRVRILMEISKNKKNNYISKFLGKKLDVIVEEKDVTSGFYRGTSDNYIKLLIRADRVKIGERIEVRACELTDKGLVGIPLNHI
jgi:threonylcarbamoyladenosine tRNA methylthiotransferase MtaB